MTPIELAHMQIVASLMQMSAVMRWMMENAEKVGPAVLLVVAAALAQIGRWAGLTLAIMERPTMLQHIEGQRCIFY